MRGALLAGLLAALPVSGQSESELELRLWAGAGFDSNARRDFVADNGSSGLSAEPDGVSSLLGSVRHQLLGERLRVTSAYDLGLRQFWQLPSEDLVAQAASVELGWTFAPSLEVGVGGRGKDRRGAARDYTDLGAEAFVLFLPAPEVELQARLGPRRFLYWNAFDYGFTSLDTALSARYRFDRHHSVFLLGDFGSRGYAGLTHPVEGRPQTPREDGVLSAGAGYSFRGKWSFTASYRYLEQSSNSFGESLSRHRLTAVVGARLPWELTALGQVAVQASRYPDGVWLSNDLQVDEDDEVHNALTVKLVRPVGRQLDLELRTALYLDRLPQNGLTYVRQVTLAGVSWRN